MRLIIQPNYDLISKWTANYIAKCILNFKPSEERPFVLGLPTGSSPVGTYKELIQLYKSGIISFKNVVTFNMDEYVDLPEGHPEGYHSFMNKYFFDHIDIDRRNINVLNGNAPDL
jgi:glucosamine-6-phosphate deaminase